MFALYIYKNLLISFQVPSTAEELKEYTDQFALKWQIPHCFRAIVGKHFNNG